jgi:hypothetical protein
MTTIRSDSELHTDALVFAFLSDDQEGLNLLIADMEPVSELTAEVLGHLLALVASQMARAALGDEEYLNTAPSADKAAALEWWSRYLHWATEDDNQQENP